MIYESLSDEGLVDFSAATSVIDDFFQTEQLVSRSDSEAARAVADLMHLNAAEASTVLQATRAESIGLPLAVPEESAQFAIWATNSGPFVGHDPRENPALWDVTLLGSDASKLAWLSGSPSVEKLRQNFDSVIRDLASLYAGREDPFGYGLLQAFDLRTTLWRAKIAVLLGEEEFPILVTGTLSRAR